MTAGNDAVHAHSARRRVSRAAGPRLLPGALALLLAVAAPPAAASSRIAYAHNGRISVVTPAGAFLGTTGKAGAFITDIAASDDGRRIAVLENTGTDGSHGNYYRAYVRTAGKRKLQPIAIGGPIKSAGAPSVALSPKGRLLAISIGEKIRLVDLVSKRRWFLRGPGNGFDIQPTFTADGRHLVFCHGWYPSPFRLEVFKIRLGGKHARRLTHSRRDEYFPQLSPDGRHLAFLRRAEDGFDLIVARVDGTRERVVRHVLTLFSRPDFSPRGNRLAYASVRSRELGELPPWRVVTARLDGSGRRTVVHGIHGGPVLPQWTRVP
jgi:hypothetical protein